MNLLPKQQSAKGPADRFTGDVYFDVIAPGTEARAKVNAVHFTPGARTAWHRHANGQTLYVTEGVCRTQSRGSDVVEARPGDVIWCPPGEWHWHGAAPDRLMTHLAIWDGLAEGQDGPETEWGEHVTDGEYAARRDG